MYIFYILILHKNPGFNDKIRETTKRRPWPDPGWSAIGMKRNTNMKNASSDIRQISDILT
jgi:hypothetical protein